MKSLVTEVITSNVCRKKVLYLSDILKLNKEPKSHFKISFVLLQLQMDEVDNFAFAFFCQVSTMPYFPSPRPEKYPF